MQEQQVTIEGETRSLAEPFIVLATQNPIEQEGTYPLPEAQVDRFLIKLRMGYPAPADEKRMLGTYDQPPPPVRAGRRPVATCSRCRRSRRRCSSPRSCSTTCSASSRSRAATRSVYLGASPRAGLALVHAVEGRSRCCAAATSCCPTTSATSRRSCSATASC